MKKIGIIGGTFDPVHLGHVGLAQDAKRQCNLDEVWFIPAKIQPFKQDKKVTDEAVRLKMLDIALSGDECLKVNTIEMELEGVSYTYRTMRALKERYGSDYEFYFITGADSFVKLDTWMHHEELLSENKFIVGSRPGYMDAELLEAKDNYEKTYGTDVAFIENEQIDISSTQLRERLAQGISCSEYLPEGLEEYINGQDIY